ncbi:SDR family oxidoreductase [Spirillospora sp. NPDC048911]|uniref:SDR family oxidoreductase n=1 Tax=Spirillospora sp. NPDC048911 TaxID=3364527 RepID=UPI00371B0331
MTEHTTIALVTGANKGIGLEVAGQLAARGMTVLLAARHPGRRERAAADLRAKGLDVHPLALDVTDAVSVRDAAAHVGERFGVLDVLVNNAGISGGAAHPPSTADVEVMRRVFDTNVLGVVRVTTALLPLLKKSQAGRVVNISSGTGSMAQMTDPEHYMSRLPAQIAYPASKAALNMVTVQYAKELHPLGILVNAAAPGACATDFTRDVPMKIDRTAADGAAIAVKLATLGPDGPTGGFFDDDGPVRW